MLYYSVRITRIELSKLNRGGILMGLILFILILTTALAVHELGHAVVMVNNGVELRRIGLGFPLGRPLFQWQWKRFPGINFEIHPLLLGAFVEPTTKGSRHMKSLSYKAKADIYAAGAWANIVFYLVVSLMVGLFFLDQGLNHTAYARTAGICAALLLFRHFFRRYLLPIIGLVWFGLILYLISQDPLETVSGPVGIVAMAKDQSVNVVATILFGGYISLMLGLFNAIPVYPLDGGKIVEIFFKNDKARQVFRAIGMATFLSIILLAFATDFINLLA